MAVGTGDTLTVKLEVKDSFTSQLTKFKTALNSTESAFTKFVSNFDKASQKAEKTLDNLNQKMDKTSQKIITSSEKVSTSIIKSSDKVQQRQIKQMEELLAKYMKMGGDIQTIFKNVQKDADNLNKSGVKVNVGSNKRNNNNNNNNNSDTSDGSESSGLGLPKVENVLGDLLSGNFMKIIGGLGLIGSLMTGVMKGVEAVENWTQMSFEAFNTVSTGLLSVDGIKQGLETAGEFENNRVAMNVLMGDDNKGLEYYQQGFTLAQSTQFGEAEIGALQKKMAGTGTEWKTKDLTTMLDIASIKPEMGADHVGFAIADAMAGRTTPLKTNYMLDNKEIQKYLKKAMKGQITDKDTNEKVDGKKWKNAFNKKGGVDNKQEYLDLLMSYVQNDTKYNGLTEKMAQTLTGQMGRLGKTWDVLKADLLGIDTKTGMGKDGINVFNSIKGGITEFTKWLKNDNTKKVLDEIGTGLGIAVKAIVDGLTLLTKDGKLAKIGDIFIKLGQSIADMIDKLTKSKILDKFIESLPDVAERAVGTKVTEVAGVGLHTKDMAEKNYVGAGLDDVYGYMKKARVALGTESTDTALKDMAKYSEYSTGQKIAMGFGINPNFQWNLNPDDMLSQANAYQALNENDKLSNSKRKELQDMIENSNQTTWNVSIGEIKSDNFEEIMASLNKYQEK